MSGNSNTGTLTSFTCSGASGWTGSGTTTNPYALQFDSAGYVATNVDVQPSAMANMTWEIWVKPTRINYGTRQQIMSDDDGGFDRSLLIESGTDKISVFTGSSAPNVWKPVSVDFNQWQHIAVVFTSSDIVLYKNGVAYDRGTAFGGAGATTKKLNIGANPAFGEKLQGLVGLFAVYNRALSATEITKHCNDYVSRFSGVICH